jgi:hypothetical protein
MTGMPRFHKVSPYPGVSHGKKWVILACGIAIKQCMEDGSSLLRSLVLRGGLVFFGVLIKNDEPS